MDKNAIKKYAVWARTELIDRVSQKALQYGITEKDSVPASATSVNGVVLSKEEMAQRKALLERIARKGYKQVMEEVAYTWFNRFSALRFMEVNGYLPSRVRVFTDENDQFEPQIIAEAIDLEMDGLDMDKVYAFKDANDKEGLFKYLIIVQCNALSPIMPGMFQRIADYTELLFPDNLLREGSAVQRMIEWIPEEDWKDQVQIIGWLYQFYNIEPKAEVFAKKTGKISKEEIPAATQLFTPDWIVRYMVENSLGRLWIEGHPDENLRAGWAYYLDEAVQEPEVKAQLEKIRKEYAGITPEQIKCIDPCSGSGHICAYMFDVLMQIYETYGYTAREAVRSIVENNIYGLDIDERAAQLAYFSVMMKARQYDRRYLTRKDEDGKPDVPQPRVYEIVESNGLDRSAVEHFIGGDPALKKAINSLIAEMHDAKEYGSILNITPVDFDALYRRFDDVLSEPSIFNMAIENDLMPFVKVAEVMAQKYDVVTTNPPYMGLKSMPQALFDYVMKNHPHTKNDLYGVFLEVALDCYAKNNGLVAMITQHVWMFTSGFEKYRVRLFSSHTISSLVHLGTRAFEEISGEVVQTCAFVINKALVPSYSTKYVRLVSASSASQKEEMYLSAKNQYTQKASMFSIMPGTPVCYWLSQKVYDAYSECPLIGDVSSTRQGLKTSDDKRFVRFIHEVDQTKIAHGITSIEQAASSGKKWFWLNKGGQDKWYGNNIYLINWENDGREVKDYAIKVAGSYSKNITAIDAYFKECLSWPQISISHPAFRYIPQGYIFASAGPSLFVNNPKHKWYYLGLLNSCVTQELLDAINPTINFGVSDILKLPLKYSEDMADAVESLVKECVDITIQDWDSSEISWDFKVHPLVALRASGAFSWGDNSPAMRLSSAYKSWEMMCNGRFDRRKANEEELNRIFIDIYGLQDELNPEVEDKDVAIRKADLSRDIRSFISYAVGCIFGRYSLDVPGLAYAGGEWDESKYTTFHADKDNILPICDDDYFKDDIVGLFVKFVERVYGKDTLEVNLRFIADALGGKGAPRDVIRSYFLNEFYADHLKMYQKRPIYWLFDSGKKNGFKALVYMHRYQPDTIARMRTDYVHEQQARYRTAIADLEQRIASASTSERVKLSKRLKTLQDQATEIQGYEEKIHHLADQYIAIDLDDGVKVNYAKFQDVLAKIK